MMYGTEIYYSRGKSSSHRHDHQNRTVEMSKDAFFIYSSLQTLEEASQPSNLNPEQQ